MDRITKSLLERFVLQNHLDGIDESKAFEYFVGYITTSMHFQESFDLADIITGGGGDCGIDSITILVNGSFISEPEEIDDLILTSAYLDVEFVLTQSEISPNFDMQKIGQFCFGVEDFFKEESSLPQNDNIKMKKLIIDKIYNNSQKFKLHKPNLYLYYVTTGKWADDTNLIIRSEAGKNELLSLSIFEKVEFEFLDADKIQEQYRKIETGTIREIKIDNFMLFPEVNGIDQSFISYIDSNEFIKLLINDDGSINQSIFYDNIRDWQELNPVNKEIAETINNEGEKKYFHLLNNGITIVADEIIQTGKKFLLNNYQIVNGCQTSYTIYNNKNFITRPIIIPVKLISTKDLEIKNKIIKATNRQIPITDDMLYALSELPKKLELYFESFSNDQKLFFERRPKQYARNDSIEKTKIINLQNLVRSFASAFLCLPHQTTRNYKLLIKNNIKKIFAKDNVLEMYYLCALLNYKIETILKNKYRDNKYRPVKWHMIMSYVHYSCKEKLPRFNSNKMKGFCEMLIKEALDDISFEKKITMIFSIVNDVANDNWQRDNIRTEVFTNNTLTQINDKKRSKQANAHS